MHTCIPCAFEWMHTAHVFNLHFSTYTSPGAAAGWLVSKKRDLDCIWCYMGMQAEWDLLELLPCPRASEFLLFPWSLTLQLLIKIPYYVEKNASILTKAYSIMLSLWFQRHWSSVKSSEANLQVTYLLIKSPRRKCSVCKMLLPE